MYVRTFPPHGKLRPYVRFYWLLEPDETADQPERLGAGVYPDLIIQLGRPARYKLGEGTWETRRLIGFIEGLFKEYFQLRFSRSCRLVGIRFTSLGLYPLVKTPMVQFTNRFTDLTDVFHKEGTKLIEQLAEETSENGLPSILDRFLFQHLTRIEADGRLTHAIRIMMEKDGMALIHRVAAEASMHERQLERAFDRHIGVSPERFSQRLRLNHFIRLAQHPHRASFTRIAYECGFADQSHLIRTFKRHIGLAPREYFREHHPIQQALNSND